MKLASIKVLAMAAIVTPLRANSGRAALAAIAIALGVALGFAIYLMNRAATTEMNAATRSLFGEADLVIAGTSSGFDEQLYGTVAQQPLVALASPVVEVPVRVVPEGESLTMLGLDFLRVSRLQPAVPAATRDRKSLSLLDPDLVLLSAPAANALHLAVGDSLTVRVGTQTATFKVAGVLPPDAYRDRIALLDIAAAQWRLGFLGKLTRIDLRLADGADPEQAMRALSAVLPADVKITTSALEAQDARQLTRAFAANLTALALVALFTGGFLVYSMQALSVMRRRREFALLHALGMSARHRIGAVVATGALLGLPGAIGGAALGVLLASLGLKALGTNLGPGFASDSLPQLTFTPLEFTAFAALGVLVSVLGSVIPALAAARVPTAAALKSGDLEERASSGYEIVGVVLWILAVLILFVPPIAGLPLPGYVSIALLLFGGIAFMPAFTAAVFASLPNIERVTFKTAIAQLRGAVRQATISVSGILVSISLMVAMAIMVASLRGSFGAWLERLLPADVYVQAGGAGQSTFLDDTSVHSLQSLDVVARAERLRSLDVLLPGERTPVALMSRRMTDAAQIYVIDRETKEPPPSGATPIFISVALADRLKLSPSDRLPFAVGGKSIVGYVRGIVRDYSNSLGSILIDSANYEALTGDRSTTSMALWLKPDVSLDAAMAEVRKHLPDTVGVRAQRDIRERSLAIFDRTFAVTYLLEAVAVLIGMFGISVSASAQVLARRAEFGVLRHLGFTRRQIGTLLTIDGLCLGTLGVIAGIAMGMLISGILIYVVSRQSFHWTMDLHVPLTGLITLVIAVPLAAALTARWSGRAALSEDVVRAVKEDW